MDLKESAENDGIFVRREDGRRLQEECSCEDNAQDISALKRDVKFLKDLLRFASNLFNDNTNDISTLKSKVEAAESLISTNI